MELAQDCVQYQALFSSSSVENMGYTTRELVR
jgi:hypothetical protein